MYPTFEERADQDWYHALTPGDVVLYHFPFHNHLQVELGAVPCLILDAWHSGEKHMAKVCVGFTGATIGYPRYHFEVTDRRELRKAGLIRKTVFSGASLVSTPLDTCDFEYTIGGSPVIGRLTGQSLACMHAMRTLLYHDMDIGRERLL